MGKCNTRERVRAVSYTHLVEKPVLYEKCEACDRTDYQNAKAKYETQKEQLAGDVYKRQSVPFSLASIYWQ